MKPSRLRQILLVSCTAVAMAFVAGCDASPPSSAPHSSARSTPADPGASSRHAPAPSATSTSSPGKKASPGKSPSGHVSSTGTKEAPIDPLAGTYHPVTRPGKVAAKRISATRGTFTSPVRYRDGLRLAVTKVEEGVESGHGPGDFFGRHDTLVTLRLTNKTHKAINLEQVVVQMTYGSPARVASPVYGDNKTVDFAAAVEPGHSATAVYAFAVPVSQRDAVTMRVDFDGLHAVAKFVGSVK